MCVCAGTVENGVGVWLWEGVRDWVRSLERTGRNGVLYSDTRTQDDAASAQDEEASARA